MKRKIKKIIDDQNLRLGVINLLLEPAEKKEEYFKKSKEDIEGIIKSEETIITGLNQYQISETTQLRNRLNRIKKRWNGIKYKYS